MRRIGFLSCRLVFAACLAALMVACKENIDKSMRYVFKYDTALSYLQKHEAYSEYTRLAALVPVSRFSQCTVAQLLSARGHYTVFAPTNAAIEEYLREVWAENPDLMGGPTWDDFHSAQKRDSIQRVIVLNSVINSGDDDDSFMTYDFPVKDKAEFPLTNMMDHRLSVHTNIAGFPDSLYINGNCPISIKERDIKCLNGVIHQMERVIAPKDVTAAMFIQEILEKEQEGLLVMAKAIQACGLMDTLSKIRDEVYEDLYQRGLIPDLENITSLGFNEGNTAYSPRHRLYGFTIFAETDEFWRSQGLDPQESPTTLIPKLQQWILENKQYSEEYDSFEANEHYASPENLLYQWTTYHMLPMRIPADQLVYHISEYGYQSWGGILGVPVYEYYSTMGKRRLIKIYESKESEGIYLNRVANIDNGRHGSGHEISCDADKVGCRIGTDSELAVLNDIVNCCIYPIDAPLALTDDVRNNLGRERIRFDCMSLLPEVMNNDIRLKRSSDERHIRVHIPNTVSLYDYCPDMQMNEYTHCMYYNIQSSCPNLHTDEMKGVGRYEITLTMPPVPRAGVYELRYKVLVTAARGTLQLYFGNNKNNLPVTGIPIDFTKDINFPRYGYEGDTMDDDYNAEVEKRMRNNGVMKGGLAVAYDGLANDTERDNLHFSILRHLIWRGYMNPNQTYYLKLKSVLDSDRKEFYMDYLEFCPKEIYDNPVTPEDIW